ncbi:hypothetical protein A2631_03265 [Candidatus Daviesbacteria bacterium RIFCSPHIGHO2_01_FULL_44_29]|uniref:Uncharacterized protein n=1 Tax=Candidatus Daviesbacteria bacterium RIFCSPHIGHO2_02_FULL_43_12 TaxID=1797776 RepID=A0A1F5KKF1_9BACT|nr:MAG: hypothetical protein A2631_03265 [Candidatus Daviesbacteria bacterium RIFCSPHIGHO2_01_FULL_44_29]OGE40297.1 MAG: hypothetical protein A3E86_03815 [Candidatus Daviesbacteria bacterium RIFCSPHIGHO2_12_FULL_47_45]OGE41403.1 MAG: hypothetical protein A3D25_02660 [Candidatus Daviesbacteria bacterium RIFCSPHIGHO2_02_FULL_43_12]OGE69603.1 MAG: hypothetical protein A3B55_04405 [Candidatus Daviesbacteria bacterium RIFCSPLOWO2_01_FULL_43_15]
METKPRSEIGPLIDAARSATATLKPSPSGPTEIPLEVIGLASRLAGHPEAKGAVFEKKGVPPGVARWKLAASNPETKDTLVEETAPLRAVRWRSVDTRPSFQLAPNPLNFEIASSNTGESENAQSLQDKAQKLLDANDANDLLQPLQEIAQRRNDIHLHGQRPPELNALVILLYKSRFGAQSLDESPRHIPRVLEAILPRLRRNPSGGETDILWSGTGRTPWPGAADLIIHELSQIAKPVNQMHVDVSIMTALACGDALTALSIAQAAQELLPQQGDAAPNSALGRSRPMFEVAYDLYPPAAKAQFDRVVASIGRGRLSGLETSDVAKRMREAAQTRAEKRMAHSINNWYIHQQVIDPEQRAQLLDPPQLQAVIEQAAAEGMGWAGIDEGVQQLVERVIDGQMANIISSELARRIHPENSVDVLTRLSDIELRQLGINIPVVEIDEPLRLGFRGTYAPNEFSGIYHQPGEDPLADNQGTKLNNISAANSAIAGREIAAQQFTSGRVGLVDLISLLRNPSDYVNWLAYTIRRDLRQDRDKPEMDQEVTRRRRIVAQKLVGGVNFIQALAENPQTRQILQREFGFGDWVEETHLRESHLDKVQEALRDCFKDPTGPELGITIYDACLIEGQYDEDRKVAEQLAAAKPAEVSQLARQTNQKARGVLAEVTDTYKGQLADLVVTMTKEAEMESTRSQLQAQLDQLDTRLTDLNRATVVPPFLKWIVPGATTDTEKARLTAQIQSTLKTVKESLSTLEQPAADTGPGYQEQEAKLRGKIAQLQNVLPPATIKS